MAYAKTIRSEWANEAEGPRCFVALGCTQSPWSLIPFSWHSHSLLVNVAIVMLQSWSRIPAEQWETGEEKMLDLGSPFIGHNDARTLGKGNKPSRCCLSVYPCARMSFSTLLVWSISVSDIIILWEMQWNVWKSHKKNIIGLLEALDLSTQIQFIHDI